MLDLSVILTFDLESPNVNCLQKEPHNRQISVSINSVKKGHKIMGFFLPLTLKAQQLNICTQCCQLHNDTSSTSLFYFFLELWPRNIISLLSVWQETTSLKSIKKFLCKPTHRQTKKLQ